jgi:hypothetical protein
METRIALCVTGSPLALIHRKARFDGHLAMSNRNQHVEKRGGDHVTVPHHLLLRWLIQQINTVAF